MIQSEEAKLKVEDLGVNVIAVGLESLAEKTDLIFLAVPFGAAEEALSRFGDLTDKIIVDCTNPVGSGMTHGLKSEISGTSFLQNKFPQAKFVKAFTIYGFENFQNTSYPYTEVKPAMLIAGDNKESKAKVSELVSALGWDPVDTGDSSMALHLEHMTLLWIKMGRVQGIGSNFTWAMLKR